MSSHDTEEPTDSHFEDLTSDFLLVYYLFSAIGTLSVSVAHHGPTVGVAEGMALRKRLRGDEPSPAVGARTKKIRSIDDHKENIRTTPAYGRHTEHHRRWDIREWAAHPQHRGKIH